MKQLLVLSGKGGTGKTTVSSALIELSRSRACADCDVDAPNLHLVLTKDCEPVVTDYYGLGKAVIDGTQCTRCGLCEENCRFGAIKNDHISLYACEGCGTCAELCPVQAVTIDAYASGSQMLYKDHTGVFSTAKLKMGSGASGKLVSAVKKQLHREVTHEDLAIIDGSPGIGCPVIASVSGVDKVLIVAEPTLSGLHDMKRILATTRHFGAGCSVCINKFDVSPEIAEEIEVCCQELSIPVIGRIPYDETVIKAVNSCRSIASYPDSPAGKAIAEIWERISQDFACPKT